MLVPTQTGIHYKNIIENVNCLFAKTNSNNVYASVRIENNNYNCRLWTKLNSRFKNLIIPVK